MNKSQLLAVHLYNDYSGSPRVLADSIACLQEKGWKVSVLTSATEGFLSQLDGVTTHQFDYSFSPSRILRLWRWLRAQWQIGKKIWTLRHQLDAVYVNTLLPFGAALMAKLLGLQVIYHLHETSLRPHFLKKLLKSIARLTADQLIYVSNFLAEQEPIKGKPATIIYNTLSPDFIRQAQRATRKERSAPFTCLMACSLKAYKGIDQFVELAWLFPNCRFELVLNAELEAINNYFTDHTLPDNFVVFPKQKNIHWFYQRADVVLNLSLADQWIETFGMTLLEGMAYGKPLIGPAVGGPTELIKHRVNGFQCDAYDTTALVRYIENLRDDHSLYDKMSAAASVIFQRFDPQQRANLLGEVFGSLSTSHSASSHARLNNLVLCEK